MPHWALALVETVCWGWGGSVLLHTYIIYIYWEFYMDKKLCRDEPESKMKYVKFSFQDLAVLEVR